MLYTAQSDPVWGLISVRMPGDTRVKYAELSVAGKLAPILNGAIPSRVGRLLVLTSDRLVQPGLVDAGSSAARHRKS